MHILFLSAWFPYPPDNGSKIRVYHLLKALAQQHEVTLLAFAFDTAQPDDIHNLQTIGCQTIRVVPINPYQVNQAGSLRTFLSARPVVTWAIPQMRQLVDHALQTERYNAVIASTGMMADYALQAPPQTAKILEEHNSFTRWMRERVESAVSLTTRLRYWVSWQKTGYYEARLFRQFDQVVMVSEPDRQTSEYELPGYRQSVAVIPNGVDCRHNRPGLSATIANRLVFNGALTYQANYEAMAYFLRQIYPRIKTAIPDLSLTITGSTDGVDLTGLALDQSVQLTGWVEDVRQPVAQAAVCVVPLLQGGGTRLKILEAMALGTPVVATSKGAEGLNVQPGIHLLLADTPESFAASVIHLLRRPEAGKQIAEQARHLVETDYDWQSIGQQFAHLVEDVVIRKEKAKNG